ncbi:alpha/beta fold hydrolase [Streptomyces sp. SID6139]|nr:alpha/beta fold hydrolase [Streptomyces sp. SID6139]
MTRNLRKRIWTAILLLSALGGALAAVAPQAAAQPLSYRPIVFVHGFNSGPGVWSSMPTDGRLAYRFDYSNRTGPVGSVPSIEQLGKDLKEAIDKEHLLEKSPDGTIDIVAHSMGGLVARSYMKNEGGIEHVKHLVTLGTPNHGTVLAGLPPACSAQCKDMAPTSDFLRKLNGNRTDADETPKSRSHPGYPKYTTFRSNVGDEPVMYTNSRGTKTGLCDGVVFGVNANGAFDPIHAGDTPILRGAENTVTPCIAHSDYMTDTWTQQKTLDALTEPGDKFAPARGFTKCNDLSLAKGAGDWTQGWMQSCLETDTSHRVTPVIRVRGCGHWRTYISWWYYVPEGWGDNTQCNVNYLKATFTGPRGSQRITIPGASTDYMVSSRAFEVKLTNYQQTGPGRYSLENPQVGFYIWGWQDGGYNYARYESGRNVELDNSGLVTA